MRVPHLKSVRRARERGHRAGEKHAKSPGLGCFHGKVSHAPATKSQARPAEGNLASLLNFLCYSGHLVVFLFPVLAATGQAGRAPHASLPPAPGREPGGEPGPEGTHRVSSTAAHLSQLLKPPRLLPPVSKKSLLHSLTHAHTPQILHHKLVQNERLQFSRSGRGKAAWEARGRACLPSSHRAAWRPGRAPPRRSAGPARETTAASPQPFFSL